MHQLPGLEEEGRPGTWGEGGLAPPGEVVTGATGAKAQGTARPGVRVSVWSLKGHNAPESMKRPVGTRSGRRPAERSRRPPRSVPSPETRPGRSREQDPCGPVLTRPPWRPTVLLALHTAHFHSHGSNPDAGGAHQGTRQDRPRDPAMGLTATHPEGLMLGKCLRQNTWPGRPGEEMGTAAQDRPVPLRATSTPVHQASQPLHVGRASPAGPQRHGRPCGYPTGRRSQAQAQPEISLC